MSEFLSSGEGSSFIDADPQKVWAFSGMLINSLDKGPKVAPGTHVSKDRRVHTQDELFEIARITENASAAEAMEQFPDVHVVDEADLIDEAAKAVSAENPSEILRSINDPNIAELAWEATHPISRDGLPFYN